MSWAGSLVLGVWLLCLDSALGRRFSEEGPTDVAAIVRSIVGMAAAGSGRQGCPSGMHLQLNRRWADHHVVNPNCQSFDGDLDCSNDEQHIVLAKPMAQGEMEAGPCNQIVRKPPIWGEEAKWDIDECLPAEELTGNIEVQCVWENGKATLEVTQYSCQEHVPFSVIWEHDQNTIPSPLAWASKQPGDSFEFAELDCQEPSPEDLLLEGEDEQLPSSTQTVAKRNKAETEDSTRMDVMRAGLMHCEERPGCQGVALAPESSGGYKLLKRFSCNAGPSPPPIGLKAKQAVHIRLAYLHQVPEDVQQIALEERVGTVVEDWHLEGPSKTVLVKFPVSSLQSEDATRLVALWPEQLEVVDGHHKTWKVVRKVRPRKIVCNALELDHSCDIDSKHEAIVLFDDPTKTVLDCQKACMAKAQNTSLLTGCCVLSDSICALTAGQHFKLRVGEHGTKHPEKQYNKNPDKPEWAGNCHQELCTFDPTCSLETDDHMPSTMVPPTTDPDAIRIYFDFAHPLTRPFFMNVDADSTPAIYHFTQKELSKTKLQDRKFILPVGSIKSIGEITHTGVAELLMHDLRTKRSSEDEAQESLHEDEVTSEAQTIFNDVCHTFGERIGRRLLAPQLQELLAEGHRCVDSADALGFEECLMKIGCEQVSGELLPFAAPWFPQLAFDILAWQTPAPFCCAIPYAVHRRDESRLVDFFEKAGLEDPHRVDLAHVDNPGAKQAMQKSLVEGRSSLSLLLRKFVKDDATLDWLARFVEEAMKAFKRSIVDFVDTISMSSPSPEESDDAVEASEDGQSILQYHEEGDTVAPSGRRALEIARWSEGKGSFLQVSNGTLQKLGSNIKHAVEHVYEVDIKPAWKFFTKHLKKWGLPMLKWIWDNPRTVLFISKFALQVRNRLCEKASNLIWSQPDSISVGLFAKFEEKKAQTTAYLGEMFSPAVILSFVQKTMLAPGFFSTLTSFGTAVFSGLFAWTGLLPGGAVMMMMKPVVDMIGNIATDACKGALEVMVYQEIAKEIPSNLFDMLNKETCLWKRDPRTKVTWTETKEELAKGGQAVLNTAVASTAMASKELSKQVERLNKAFGSVLPGH